MSSRKDELAANLADVNHQIQSAAKAAGRDPSDITLIVVTKTFPASDIVLLAQLGVLEVGENKDQEASGKFEECQQLGLRWHFIGQLQSNKVNSVARYIDVVHSVDRPKLAIALGRAAIAANRTIMALVQVSLDSPDTPGRAGIDPGSALELAELISNTPGLTLGGVMAVAPVDEDPAIAFARLTPVVAQIQAKYPQATIVSAGMSADLHQAVAAGATHLRIGSAILGSRAVVG
jgi:hypothetical protein